MWVIFNLMEPFLDFGDRLLTLSHTNAGSDPQHWQDIATQTESRAILHGG
jgi:hypothetical protein